jgi:hypothetical protein
LNTDCEIASGRRRRPLVLLLTCLTLLSLASAGAARAKDTSPAVQPTQALVTLLRGHIARSHPAAHASSLGLVPGRAPITEVRTVLPVLARHGRWLKVRLPGRPNGHTGWISEAATGSWVTAWHLVIDTSRRELTVYRAGRRVRVFRVVVGTPLTPTPTGRFFVEESIALRDVDVGAPFALALSARSNVLQDFAGGPGQIAIHGLGNIGGVLGSAVSHGCIRLGDEPLRWLVARVGPGTPVTIAR